MQTWLEGTETLKDKAIDTTIYTRDTHNYTGNNNYNEMTTKVFLLSEADLFGTANGQATSEPKEYTCGAWNTERLTAEVEVLRSRNYCYLRSRKYTDYYVATVDSNGENSCNSVYYAAGIRPALWVTLD